MEQWQEHLIKVGVPAAEIGIYEGDRKANKHGVLTATKKDARAAGAELRPPRFTLLTKDTLLGDFREMCKTFSDTAAVRRLPLLAHDLVESRGGVTRRPHALCLLRSRCRPGLRRRRWRRGRRRGATAIAAVVPAAAAQLAPEPQPQVQVREQD